MHSFLKFILEWNSTCFGQFLCPSSEVFHSVYIEKLLMIDRGTVRKFQNKFEKLVHLVGFIIGNYHDARSHEDQMKILIMQNFQTPSYVLRFKDTCFSSAPKFRTPSACVHPLK
jgi:hypothetical protein